MVFASLAFASMGVCVKYASALYGTPEIVLYRGIVGALLMAWWSRRAGTGLATRLPAMHFWRSVIGVSALLLWFYAIGGLPLATATTLNYMSSVWMAVFLIGGAIVMGRSGIDARLFATVLAGFAGVALVLRPTIGQEQLWHGLLGLLSGMLSAVAYLQVTALGRAGEPEPRVVFWFSVGGIVAGLGLTVALGEGLHAHTPRGLLLLLAVGVLATLGQVLMTRAYGTGRPLVIASLQYLGIAYSFGFGVWLFDDPVSWMSLGGIALIVGAGLAATRLRQATPALDSRQPADS
jgi:S-adenosylmethionine uptake transporter